MSYFFKKEDMKLDVLSDKVSRSILAYDKNMMVVEVYMETGGIGTPHQHVHEQITYVLSGAFEFSVGDEKQVVRQGDTIYMPSNILHGAVCLEKGVLLDIFTPHREDFIKE
ncbi:MAG: cupin domain-containing protein [Acholeplasmataceae bacterium]